MHSPGVTVKPLRQITGDAEFNEVYFDNVRVPEAHILGGLNNGWAVGLTTLMYERLALGFGLQVRLRIALDGLVDLAQRTRKNGVARHRGPRSMRQKLAQMWIDTEVFKYTGARAITKLLKGELPGPEASAGKMMWVEGISGSRSWPWRSRDRIAQLTQGSPVGGRRRAVAVYASFARAPTPSRAARPRSRRNIIGERVLGLPKG